MRLLIAAILLSATSLIAQETMNNDLIVKLFKAGIGDDLIVSMVQSQPGKYSLSPDDVLKLKQAGISEKILTAMTKKDAGSSTGPARTVKIDAKSPIQLSVVEALSSHSANAGDTFRLVVPENVIVEGHIVIAKGAPASGRIHHIREEKFRHSQREVGSCRRFSTGG